MPGKPSKWKLTVEFWDMFFLVNYPLVAGQTYSHGGVVLLPTDGHSATLLVDDPNYQYGLTGAHVFLKDASGDLWGRPTTRDNRKHGVSANTLFGRFTMDDELLKGAVPQKRLNARVVLAGGAFRDEPANNPKSAIDWDFSNKKKKSPLTDRLTFEATVVGPLSIVIHQSDRRFEVPLADDRNHYLRFWNRDLQDTYPPKPVKDGHFVLTEYAALHSLIKPVDGSNPVLDIPEGDYTGTGGISNDEPICGGEEGDPDAPPDPPND